MSILFVGLGTMGEPMARNLYKAGHSIVLHDVNQDTTKRLSSELSVPTASTIETIPAGINEVILMLPNSDIVESVLIGKHGLIEQLEPGSLIIDMSSSRPESTRQLALIASKHDIEYVDAPVSGGLSKAITAELSIMAGSSNGAFRRAQPILATMGTNVIHVGPAGSGDAAKALNNLLSATNILTAAEVIIAATKFGIEPETMVRVLNSSTGRSQATEVKYPNHILDGKFDSGFAYDLMLKDLAIATNLTSQVDSPLTDGVVAIANKLRASLEGNADHTEIVKYIENRSSIQIRNPQETTKEKQW